MELARLRILLLVTLPLVGCSDDRLTPVRGRVTHDGQPLSGGTIHFVPLSGPSASSPIAEDGTYRLSTYRAGDGAVTGQHKVYLAAPANELGDYTLDNYAENEEPPEQPPLQFPRKYLSSNTSGLQFEVTPETREIDIEL